MLSRSVDSLLCELGDPSLVCARKAALETGSVDGHEGRDSVDCKSSCQGLVLGRVHIDKDDLAAIGGESAVGNVEVAGADTITGRATVPEEADDDAAGPSSENDLLELLGTGNVNHGRHGAVLFVDAHQSTFKSQDEDNEKIDWYMLSWRQPFWLMFAD